MRVMMDMLPVVELRLGPEPRSQGEGGVAYLDDPVLVRYVINRCHWLSHVVACYHMMS